MKVPKLLSLFLVLFFCSCTNMPKQNIVCEEYNYKPNIKECKSNKELPNGAFLGEVIQYEGMDKMEKNMISQFGSYNLALLRGDFDNASRYQYKDAITYFRKFYPGEPDEQIMRNFFSSVSEEMVQTIRKYQEHGIELNIVVSRIVRKVTQGDNIIYVFEIVSNMIGDKLQIHMSPEETIAVSTNSGKNWTFNTVNEDTPNILRVSYSDELVDKVMGY